MTLISTIGQAALLSFLSFAPNCNKTKARVSTIPAVFKKAAPSIVQIISPGGIKGLPSRGSGVIVSKEGHILTLDTFALGQGSTRVITCDGKIHQAKIVAEDKGHGVSLLKINTREKLTPIQISPPTFKAGPGEPVLLLGHPFKITGPGEKPALFLGVVSSRLRLDLRLKLRALRLNHEVLLLDAPSNPGLQGGPLLDKKGRLIGIIGRPLEAQETNTLISFAVPFDLIWSFLENALKGKKTSEGALKKHRLPPFLGIKLFDFGLRSSPPPYVQRVYSGSPAAAIGLKADDLILELGGKPTRTCREFRLVLKSLIPLKKTDLVFKRKNKIHNVSIMPGMPKGAKR